MKVLLKRTPLKPYIPDWIVGFVEPIFEDLDPLIQSYDGLVQYSWPLGPRFDLMECLAHVRKTRDILRCLSFRNGLDLARLGDIPEQFKGKHLCLWQSVAYDTGGNLFLPFMQNIPGQAPIIYWWWMGYENKETFTTPVFEKEFSIIT